MNIYFLFLFYCSFIEKIRANSSNDTDSNFWNDNIWLFILLIIFSVAIIVVIVVISIKIYKRFKNKNSQKKENFVDTERSSQQYISEYNKNTIKNKKIKYKERPLEEIEND